MSSKDAFLGAVRTALADRGPVVPLPTDLDIARVVGADEDLVAVFMARAEEAKMHVYRASDEADLLDRIMSIVTTLAARGAIVPDDGLPARDALLERLSAGGITLCDVDDADAGFVADVGITGVSGAIAETGSMHLASGAGRRRLASLAVPVHIGVVRAEQIVADLLDWTRRRPAEMPAGQVLVSAPSKTADIELTLVMGVHGPRQEHVIVLG